MLFNRLKIWIDKELKRRKWRELNHHNLTSLGYRMDFSFDHVAIGNNTYGEINVLDFGNQAELRIGNFCSIAQNVVFILNAEHSFSHLSSYPFKVKVAGLSTKEATSKGNIIIDDDVWIGYGATILSGVHIGQGAVIAANSTVVKDVMPYSIVGGNPARIIKYRFPEGVINELQKIDFQKLGVDKIIDNLDDLYRDIRTSEDARLIISKLDIFKESVM